MGIDGIQTHKNQKKVFIKKRNLEADRGRFFMDGVVMVKRRVLGEESHVQTVKPSQKRTPTPHVFTQTPRFASFKYQKHVLAIVVIVVFAAFAGGMGVALNTSTTKADQIQNLATTLAEPSNTAGTVIPLEDAPTGTPQTIGNDLLFNTPLEYLQSYLASSSAPDVLSIRKQKLTAFLKERGSPFIADVATIAEQDHWKLILAISFAESTLGKHCKYFNCSGIGGSELRSYKSTANWVLDFNRLLEKRYKDKTLEQMCGVYVQPCTSSWLLATKQILDSLSQKGIE